MITEAPQPARVASHAPPQVHQTTSADMCLQGAQQHVACLVDGEPQAMVEGYGHRREVVADGCLPWATPHRREDRHACGNCGTSGLGILYSTASTLASSGMSSTTRLRVGRAGRTGPLHSGQAAAGLFLLDFRRHCGARESQPIRFGIPSHGNGRALG